MSIEIGDHPALPSAVIIHSTESGKFMPAGREETVELINAVKRGELDGWAGGGVSSVHVWHPDPDHVAEAIHALDLLWGSARGDRRVKLGEAKAYWQAVLDNIHT
jgi:hypothetical protein